MIRFILAFFVLCVMISCGKEVDKESPKIEFITPKGEDTFSVGTDGLFLKFKLKDNSDLSHYSFVIKDDLDFKYETGGRFVGGKELEHNSNVVFGGFGGVQKLRLYVTVYDKAYNTSVASREFYVQP